MQPDEKSTKRTIMYILIAMALIALSVTAVTSPTNKLLGESAYGIRSAFHGLFAAIFMITSTVGLYQALRLWRGSQIIISEMEVGSVVNAAACFLTILFGNWLYIPYRAQGGPRTFFMESQPEIHKIFFEFKEFGALFTLPLAVTAAFIICKYADELIPNRVLRETVALFLVLSFFYFMIAFGLGAAITKLQTV